MKPLPLSDKQKEKLLEMCKHFFYKESSVRVHMDFPYSHTQKGTVRFVADYIEFPFHDMGNVDPYIAWNRLHWFEFCMTYLVERILNPHPNEPARNLQDKFKDFFWSMNLFWWEGQPECKAVLNSKHPVDYLYKEFKKLK